jgi:hypothetical protein
MDKQHCRFLLRAYRSNGADANDPSISEALKLAKNDPELSAWFAREQAIDSALVEKIREFEVPSHLRKDILNGLELSSNRRHGPRFAMLSSLTGLAAAVAFGVYALLPEEKPAEPSSFDSVVASAYDNSREMIGLNYFSASVADLREWLGEQSAPVPGDLPHALNSLKTIGCSNFEWQGVPASLISFRAHGLVEDADGKAIDRCINLYTVEKQSCSGGSAHGDPIIFARNEQSIATWRDSSRLYVLVAKAPENRLEQFLTGNLALAEVTATLGGNESACSTCDHLTE